MDPIKDNRLRAWLAPVLDQYGQELKRTPDGHENFKQLGRWSRWDRHGLLESHVDLEDLASRVRTVLNEPVIAEPPDFAELAHDRSLRWTSSW